MGPTHPLLCPNWGFKVSMLLQDAEKIRANPPTAETIAAAEAKVAGLEGTIAEMKAAKKDKRKIKKETEKLGPIKSEAEQLKKQLASAVPNGGVRHFPAQFPPF